MGKTRRALAKKKKQLEKDKKKAEKAAKKRADEAKKKLAEGIKKKEAEAKGEEYVPPEEEPVEEEPEDEEVDEPEEDVDMDEEPPKVELSAEEKKNYFRKPVIPDISTYQLGVSFSKFTVPEKDEGFDEVKFDWGKEKECKEYVKNWIRDRKSTTRIEDLQPSDWFSDKWKMWQKLVQNWHTKLQYYKQQQTTNYAQQ